MIRLNTRADWARRYWFERPISLPRGSKIEVTANLVDPDLMSAAFGTPAAPKAAGPSTLRLALNVIPAGARPARRNQSGLRLQPDRPQPFVP